MHQRIFEGFPSLEIEEWRIRNRGMKNWSRLICLDLLHIRLAMILQPDLILKPMKALKTYTTCYDIMIK